MDSMTEFDLGPLTWVKGEIDHALDAAQAELRQWNGTDETPLKAAAAYLHQVNGALQIVDLQGVSLVCGEAERLLADLEARPEMRSLPAGEALGKAIQALRSYLDGLMAGAANAEVALMPVYTELATQRGGEAPAPSDLFFPDTGARARRAVPEPILADETRASALRLSRSKYQKGLLQFLQNRDPAAGIQLMDEAVREVEGLAPGSAQYTFWWSVAGLTEAIREGRLAADFWIKRLCGRIDTQMRRLSEGSRQIADRLLRDVLYYLAQDSAGTGRAGEARALFQLDRYLPAAPLAMTGEDEAQAARLAELRTRLGAALEQWLSAAAGRRDSLASFRADLQRGRELAATAASEPLVELLAGMHSVAQSLDGVDEITANEALQVEIATALLLAQHGCEPDGRRDPAFPARARLQDECLAQAADPDADLAGQASDPLLEDLSRQAREKLLLAQVTQVIQGNLQQVEEILERYFRDPAARDDLPLVPSLMRQIEGDFRLLRLNVATELVQASMDQFAALADPGREIGADELNWIADAVSTLGLYVDVLRRGHNDPGALRALLAVPGQEAAGEGSVEEEIHATFTKLADCAARLDVAPDPGTVRAEIRAELNRLARDADLVGDRALRGRVDTALKSLGADATDQAVQAAIGALTGRPAEAAAGEPVAIGAAEMDAELLQVYLEEASEVLAAIDTGLAQLHADPRQQDALVSIRRGFHTLKGSGRMVGLDEPAEIAWEVEQTLNAWLREERAPDAPLLAFISQAAEAFRGWVRDLAETGSLEADGNAIVPEAQRLRGEAAARAAAAAATPAPEAAWASGTPAGAAAPAEEALVTIGHHRLPVQLFEIFSDEAGQRLAELSNALADLLGGGGDAAWAAFVRAAHTLAGIARTTGFEPLAAAAHAVEHWGETQRVAAAPVPVAAGPALEGVITRLADQLAAIHAGRFPAPLPDLPAWLAEAAGPPVAAEPAPSPAEAAREAPARPAAPPAPAPEPEPEPVDELDQELLPIFLAEAEELLPRLGLSLRQWRDVPGSAEPRQGLQRALHTLKGSARMTGAMRLGEAAHALETRIIELGEQSPDAAFLAGIELACDRLAESVDALKLPMPEAPALATAQPAAGEPPRPRQVLKARPELLDTLINEAGEVSIVHSRLENVLFHYKMTVEELTANVERLRSQLRELEMQAELQTHSRLAIPEAGQFDPLEFERYTRLQELTRLMAESVDDVSTAYENLVHGLGEAEEALVHQGRMARSLQQALMHIRMVPLDSQAERLHRIVRQAAGELGRQARLTITGGQTEVDRTVLDRVQAPLEHLLRNALAHGIEAGATRLAAGKPEAGAIRLTASQEGHEFVLVLEDDGAGVDLDKVRRRAEALGWLRPGESAGRERLESFLFLPGFSTVEQVSQVAGRGVGLDVVRSEIAGIGGRVRLDSDPGRGTRFTLRLPISLALTQVVLAVAGNRPYALPANTVVLVKEVKAEEWQAISSAGRVEFEGQVYPLRSLAELTAQKAAPLEGKFRTVLLLRSGTEHLALRVDRLDGNLEAVVKPIGPQLSRIVGIAGVTQLGDGRVALILDPFVLMERVPALSAEAAVAELVNQPPLILVVDDSLTVRKITGRLLHRSGYRVATAKDGVDALEALQEERPAAMLLDIEMPRMDGFEVARHVRADAHTRDLPIIMISSRSAEKHRQHALDLGVNTYMGKPYKDEELLSEIRRLTGAADSA